MNASVKFYIKFVYKIIREIIILHETLLKNALSLKFWLFTQVILTDENGSIELGLVLGLDWFLAALASSGKETTSTRLGI